MPIGAGIVNHMDNTGFLRASDAAKLLLLVIVSSKEQGIFFLM